MRQYVNGSLIEDTSVRTHAWSVADEPGNIFWFRADSKTLVVSKVSVAIDKSPYARNATQGTDASRPTYSATGGPNSTPSWSGAGSQSLLTAAFGIGTKQLDVWAVVQPNNSSAAGEAICGTGDGTGGAKFAELIFGGDYYDGAHFGAQGAQDWESSATTASSAHLMRFTHDKTVSTEQVKVYTDGTLTPQTVYNDDNVTDVFGTFALMLFGANSSSMPLGEFSLFNGKIMELIGFDRLCSATTVTRLKSYITARYAFTLA